MKTSLSPISARNRTLPRFFSFTKKRFAIPRRQGVPATGTRDRSGTIEARMWDQFDAAVKDINRDDFVKSKGGWRFTAIGPSFRCSNSVWPSRKKLISPIFFCTQKKTSENCTPSCSNMRTRLQIRG